MKKNNFDDFKKEAMHDYFTMQIKNDRNRKIFKYLVLFLMLILPFLLVSYKSMKIVLATQEASKRVEKDQKEIEVFGNMLLQDQEFMTTLSFKENTVVVQLDTFYGENARVSLEKKYFDKAYTHQCLGYLTFTKEESIYKVDTSTYCKM